MVHVTLSGRLFAVDLRSPTSPAKRWVRDRWTKAAFTNEEILFDPAARSVPPRLLRVVQHAVHGAA